MTELAEAIVGTTVPVGAVALWWTGQGSFVFKGSGGVLAVDPYLSDAGAHRANPTPRMFPPPILPEELARLATAVLATHEHLDHVDPEATPELVAANPQLRFIGPRGVRAKWAELGVPPERITPFDVGDTLPFGPWTLTATFADHHADGPIGFVLDTGTARIYHSGDTEAHPRLAEVLPFAPDLVTIVINGRGGNMDATDAARTVAMLGARAAIPTHYDLFPNNLADPQEFVRALAREAPIARAIVLPRGQALLWPEQD